MPEATLQALADHGKVDALPAKEMNDTARTLDDFVKAGVNLSALGAQLQEEGATSFVKSWNDLLNVISSKTASLQQAA
jgi:transaldolase